MPRGGARPGAGRRPGTPNRATAEREALVREGGETPLDHMLAVMRNADKDPARRLEAAKAAAPYVHPKLSAVEVSGKDGGPVKQEHKVTLDDDTIERVSKRLLDG